MARTPFPYTMLLVDTIQANRHAVMYDETTDGVGGTRLQAGDVETDSRNGRRACAEGQGQQLFIAPVARTEV